MFTNPSRSRLKELLEDLAGKGSSKIEFVDLRPHFVQMRMIKQDYELAMIRKAIDGTTELFQKIDSILDEAKNEHEIHAEVVKFAINKQMKFAYDPIIAGGPNAVTLHYERTNSKLDKSLPILLDIGLKYRGYSADITRTVCRKPTSRQEAVYNGVLGVQKYAIGLLMPGINLKDYEKRINEYMGEKLIELGLIKTADMESIRKYYPHSTSHFLGIDVHDVADYDRPLEPGMVLTVEPGIYIKDEAIGVRIEDNILITADGNENLSNQLLKELRSLRM